MPSLPNSLNNPTRPEDSHNEHQHQRQHRSRDRRRSRLPKVTITREFDAPADRVYAAHVDPEIFARWIGPSKYQVTIDRWHAETGGSYRYATGEHWFFGSFHQVLPEQHRIVQTWGWEGMPDAVSLEFLTVTDLPGGRSQLTTVSLVDSMQAQAMMLASGMETGVNEGYAKLDALLAERS